MIEHLLFWQNWLSYPEKFALAEKTTVYYNDGTTPIGSYAEQMLLHEHAVVKVRQDVPFGALAEPGNHRGRDRRGVRHRLSRT